MIEITVVYEEPEQIKNLIQKESINWILLDQNSAKQRSSAFKIKGAYAARKCPFSVIKIDGVVQKALYTEASNVIEDLNKFTKDF